jgi:hypothetical protein
MVLPFANAQVFRSPTNTARVLDGVVNFRVTPYDAMGRPFRRDANTLWDYSFNELPQEWAPRTTPNGWPFDFAPVELRSVAGGLVTETTFSGHAMPSYLEIEIDALEPRILDQFRSLPPNVEIRNRYLTNNLSRIMSFRQRIPLRASIR